MTVCRDLTVKEKEVEVKKKPIEFRYLIWAINGLLEPGRTPKSYDYIDKVAEIDSGRCIMAAYSRIGVPADQKNFYIGYWNDGVAE